MTADSKLVNWLQFKCSFNNFFKLWNALDSRFSIRLKQMKSSSRLTSSLKTFALIDVRQLNEKSRIVNDVRPWKAPGFRWVTLFILRLSLMSLCNPLNVFGFRAVKLFSSSVKYSRLSRPWKLYGSNETSLFLLRLRIFMPRSRLNRFGLKPLWHPSSVKPSLMYKSVRLDKSNLMCFTGSMLLSLLKRALRKLTLKSSSVKLLKGLQVSFLESYWLKKVI